MNKVNRTISIPLYVHEDVKNSGLDASAFFTSAWLNSKFCTSSIVEEKEILLKKVGELDKRLQENKKELESFYKTNNAQERNMLKAMNSELIKHKDDLCQRETVISKYRNNYHKYFNKYVSGELLLNKIDRLFGKPKSIQLTEKAIKKIKDIQSKMCGDTETEDKMIDMHKYILEKELNVKLQIEDVRSMIQEVQ